MRLPSPDTKQFSFTTAMPPSGFATYGANWGLFPIFPNQGYNGYPQCGMLAFFANDYGGPDQSFISVTPSYGTAHTYVMTTAMGKPTASNGSGNSMNVWLRYD